MFAVVGLIAFIVAAILRLIGKHAGIVDWMVIIGGLAYGLHLLWGWTDAPWRRAP
jgi:hypothetical protein